MMNWEQLAGEAHYKVAALARMLNLPERTLRRYILARQHITPHVWLEQLRLQKAAELILAGMPPKTVSLQLGFKELSHFSNCFKRFHGVCPRRYWLSR